jgi:CheY-like chemotaxis protein
MERLLELPGCSNEEDTFREDPRDHSQVSASPRRHRILIVDDEPLFGQTMLMLLGTEHEVVVERTGRAGLQRLLVDRPFDLVLCDVSLPDIEGPALYEEAVRRDADLAQTFVFVTGGAFNESTREFLRRYKGARLDKPFSLTALERLLESRTRLSA